MMETSIIIPVYRDSGGLETTLASIRDQKWDASVAEIIVCNDGGGDAISALAARFGCVEARLEQNSGSYAARNAGIRIARGQTLAFIDADERVTRDWLAAGLEALNHADYVGGRIVVSAGIDPSFWERVDAAFAFPVTKYLGRWKFAPTANLFLRRQVFEAVGGFDEALTSGGDHEFGARVADGGFTQSYCERAAVFHPPRGFREQLLKARRTSRGDARLQIVIQGRSSLVVGAKAAIVGMAKICYAAALVAALPLGRARAKPKDAYLLAAGHSVIGAYYQVYLATCAFAATFRHERIQRRIPSMLRSDRDENDG